MLNNWEKKEKPIQGMMGMGGGAAGYLVRGSSINYFDGSDANNAAGSPYEIALAYGSSTPPTGLYYFKNSGFNSNGAFTALADWSVYPNGVLIFVGNHITNNDTRSWADFGTAGTGNSGTKGYRNTFRVDADGMLSQWSGDTNNKFMIGMTTNDGSSLSGSTSKNWFVIDVSPSTARNMFRSAPGTGQYTGSVSAASVNNHDNNFYWTTSHGNSIYQMSGGGDTVNSDLWMETRIAGNDGNHSPVVWGNSDGQYYNSNRPWSNRWCFMGFSPNNVLAV